MNLGMGVMIGLLSGNANSVEAFKHAIGKTLVSATLEGDVLSLKLGDGSTVRVSDDGQSCCESRYMVCDDDLSSFDGAEIVDFELRDAPSPDSPDHYTEHDVQFFVVKTTKGEIVCSNHNEHNGYYGGFLIRASLESAS